MDVVILGASGYGGGELLRLLDTHPRLRSVQGVSRQSAGKAFAAVHPNLRGVVAGHFAADIDWRALADSPVRWCLPRCRTASSRASCRRWKRPGRMPAWPSG